MKIHSFVSTLVTSVAASLVCSLPAQAQSVPGQGTWETTLLGRDINLQSVAATSSSAIYLFDTSLNVTWLRAPPLPITRGITVPTMASKLPMPRPYRYMPWPCAPEMFWHPCPSLRLT